MSPDFECPKGKRFHDSVAARADLTIGVVILLALLGVGCDKNDASASGSPVSSATSNAAPALPAADVDCDKVVEKIASLNPPDFRGEPEKKLWRKMCAGMNPAQKTCVMGAKVMDEMKSCMK